MFATSFFTVVINAIRIQPYTNRVMLALLRDECNPPCFMGIHPGSTRMRDAYFKLIDHEWVANQADDFPSLIREASHIGAWVPRTVVGWVWDEPSPSWIDQQQPGFIIVEDQTVRSLGIATHLLIGEFYLAFGKPDMWQVQAVDRSPNRQFEWTGWYFNQGIAIIAQGTCPARSYFARPVQIRFHPTAEITTIPESLDQPSSQLEAAC